jgi:hypothetical protein
VGQVVVVAEPARHRVPPDTPGRYRATTPAYRYATDCNRAACAASRAH